MDRCRILRKLDKWLISSETTSLSLWFGLVHHNWQRQASMTWWALCAHNLKSIIKTQLHTDWKWMERRDDEQKHKKDPTENNRHVSRLAWKTSIFLACLPQLYPFLNLGNTLLTSLWYGDNLWRLSFFNTQNHPPPPQPPPPPPPRARAGDVSLFLHVGPACRPAGTEPKPLSISLSLNGDLQKKKKNRNGTAWGAPAFFFLSLTDSMVTYKREKRKEKIKERKQNRTITVHETPMQSLSSLSLSPFLSLTDCTGTHKNQKRKKKGSTTKQR